MAEGQQRPARVGEVAVAAPNAVGLACTQARQAKQLQRAAEARSAPSIYSTRSTVPQVPGAPKRAQGELSAPGCGVVYYE